MEAFNTKIRNWVEETFPDDSSNFVPGDGNINARVMLIGEAPGEQEVLLGRPFVGKAGKNLDTFLAMAGLDRSAMYVTNAVKFRPTKLSKAGRLVNRPPTASEIAAFRPWLLEELHIIAPEWVVTMGNVPLHALLGTGQTIGKWHGKIAMAEGYSLYPIYHPASLIYNASLKPVYEEDLRRFKTLLSSIS